VSDAQVKGLAALGLLVQLGALAAGFTALGWRWPLVAVTAAGALLLLAGFRQGNKEGINAFILVATVVSLAAAGWHAASDAPAAAWALRIVYGLHVLLMGAFLVFLLTFRLNRLW
jgi:hypothetical protein